MRGWFSWHWLWMYLSLNHIQCPFYVFKCICISLFVDLGCNFFTPFTLLIFYLLWSESVNKTSGLWTCLKSLNNFLNDPASMDVSGQPLHKSICLLVLECYYVIRLVGKKQIPNFLLSHNRPKMFLFLPWEGWGIWILPGWGEEFEPELSSLSSKIDMFYFLVWRCLKVWSFQKC